MMKFNVILILFLLLLNGCDSKKTFKKNLDININQESYLEYKKEFDSILISHFPEKIEYVENTKIINTNREKNDIGLFLIEYVVPKDILEELEDNATKIAKYKCNSKEKNLLIVNRFETKRTKDSLEVVTVVDPLLINKTFPKKQLPIPNFIDFSIMRGVDFWKDENFNIYILDAKSGNYFKKFNLQPNPQMPKEWQNGYSKGIAISKEKKTVIYWSIIW